VTAARQKVGEQRLEGFRLKQDDALPDHGILDAFRLNRREEAGHHIEGQTGHFLHATL
jgi:hypothetical protein